MQGQASGILAMLMVPTSYANATPVHDNLRQTAGVARLGIPPMHYNEAMHGIVALCLPSGACPTAFPEQITQSEFRNGLPPAWSSLTPTVAAVSGFLQPLSVAGGGVGAGEGGAGAAQRKPRRRQLLGAGRQPVQGSSLRPRSGDRRRGTAKRRPLGRLAREESASAGTTLTNLCLLGRIRQRRGRDRVRPRAARRAGDARRDPGNGRVQAHPDVRLADGKAQR